MNPVTSDPSLYQFLATLVFLIGILTLAIIQIMFFIKIWNMTNHIKELRNKFIDSPESSFWDKLNPSTKMVLRVLSIILLFLFIDGFLFYIK